MPKEEVIIKTKESTSFASNKLDKEKTDSKVKEKKSDKKVVNEDKIKEVAGNKTEIKKVQSDPFAGKFINSLGKRKTATAQVRLYQKGKGIIFVNGLKLNEYFSSNLVVVINQSLKLTTHIKDLNFSILVKGGGKHAQAQAILHGISRALIAMDPELRPKLKAKGWLTRDARKKERKKPGLNKARRAPQWSKR